MSSSQFHSSNPKSGSKRPPKFLARHLPHPSSSNYLLTPSLVQSLKLSLFSHLLDSIPTSSYLLPRQIAPSNQHALEYFKNHGFSLPRAQKAAQEELRRAKGKEKGRERDSSVLEGIGSDQEAVLGHEYGSDRKGMPCGHVFKEGEPIYRCRDCGLDDTCVQCAPCFNASNHNGHDIVFSISSQGGGCCDCGDEEAWVQKVGCGYHDHDDETSISTSAVSAVGSSTTAITSNPGSMQQDSNSFYSSSSASQKGKGPEPSNNTEASSDPLKPLLDPIPHELFSSLSSEIENLLEYVLQVLEHAPDDTTLPKGPDALETFKRLKSLEDLEEEQDGNRDSGIPLREKTSTPSFEMMDSESEAIEGSERDAEDEAEDIFLDGEDEMQVEGEFRDDGQDRDDLSDLSAGQSWHIGRDAPIHPMALLLDPDSDEDDVPDTGTELNNEEGDENADQDGIPIMATTNGANLVGGTGVGWNWARGFRIRRTLGTAEPVTEPQGDGLNAQNILSTMSNEGAASTSRSGEGSAPIPSTSNLDVEPSGRNLFSNSDTTPQPPQNSSSFNPNTQSNAVSTPTERSYSIILWNDEKHSFSEVIDTIKDASNVDEKVAKAMAERVDKHGREIVEISTRLKRLFQLARIINHIDLTVTIRPSYDVFAEEVAGQVLNFLLDLSGASLYLPDSSSSSSAIHPHDNLSANASALRALVAHVFLRDWNHNNPSVALQGGMSKEFFDSDDLRNVDGLLLMDTKMWKEARSTTREISLMIMGTKDIKKELAIRCAKMYPRMMETFILKDREQEHSIVYMTVQLFSVPSIAEHLVRTGFLQKLFQILQAVFTGHLSSGSLKLPPPAPPSGQASPQSMPSRQQRCYQSFYDLRYLLQASGVQSQLVSQPQHLDSILDFLSLFNAITPDRRAVSAHIEFETDVWLTVFHVSSHLGRTAKLFGEAFKKADKSQLKTSIQVAVRKILSSCVSLHSNDPESHSDITFHNVEFGGKSYEAVDFDVEKQAVSFHHPMHWLLSEMLKHVSLIDPDDEGSEFEGVPSAVAEVAMSDGDIPTRPPGSLLVLLDFPLRVIVKLAQTRVGLWVRNGYALRSQAHHYKDNAMRDIMFDQDLYLLQCGFLLVQPDIFLVSIMDRFSLLDWFNSHDGTNGAFNHETYDSDQTIALADEMLLLLITLLSEVSVAASWPMERQVRREIIQFLALGQGTYSELVKNISERLTDHASFDRCLSQVSHFRPPDGTTDVGMFELKAECFDEVEPFFYHYTRNQREKAEEILSEKRKKKGGDAGVTIPHKLDIPSGPFKSILPKALVDPTLFAIVSSSLSSHVSEEAGDLPESLIESALHLLMLASVEDGPAIQQQFLEGISTYVFGKTTTRVDPNEINSTNQFTLLRLLLSLEDQSKFKAFKPKITWLLNKALEIERSLNGGAGWVSSVVSTWRSAELKKGPEEMDGNKAEDDRKAAAKARQAAIMQQFSAQQASLLASLDDDEDDEEEDEEGYDEMEGIDKEDVKSEPAPKRSLGSCILCQENLDGSQAFGSLAHVQASRVLRTTPRTDSGYLQQSLVSPLTLDQNGSDGKRLRGPDAFSTDSNSTTSAPTLSKGLFPSEDHRFGFYASTCGHHMHLGCFQSYCKSVEQRQGQQIARNHPEDLSRCEFVCPLCKSLGNVILPVPDASSHSSSHTSASTQLLRQLQTPQINETPLGEWIRKINIDILKCPPSQGSNHQETLCGTGSFLSWFAEEQYGVFNRKEWGGSTDKVDGATIQMIARLLQALKPLSLEAGLERSSFVKKSILAPPSTNMYMPEELLTYTVSVLEVSQRGIAFNPSNTGSDPLSGSIADSISDQTIQLLRSLLHCMRTLALAGKGGSLAMESLKQGLLKRLLPHWGGDEAVRSPLLLRDPLTILIEAAILIPDSIRQVTSLVFYASLVQVVFGLAQPSIWPPSHLHSQTQGFGNPFESRGFTGLRAKEADPVDLETARSIFPDVRWTVANIIGFVGFARGNITLGVDNLDDASLAKLLCSYTLPFLRRAAIIHRVVGAFNDGASPQSSGSEYVRLLDLLKIPPPAQGLPVRAEQQTPIAGLVEGWIKHGYNPLASLFRPLPIQPNQSIGFDSQGASSSSFGSGSGDPNHPQSMPALVLEHPQIYELVPLPVDLARLIQITQTRKCKKCKNVPPEPALCLLCGDLVCFQSFCCEDTVDRRGECNIHLDRCGGATGIFYRVKSNVVLLLHQKNGTFTSSPYLDTHGEIDIGLRKGRPQKLQPQRYDELRKQWLAHGISNIVARKIEALMDQGGWDTF